MTKKQFQALNEVNDYLDGIGKDTGFTIRAKPTSSLGVPIWEIEVSPIGVNFSCVRYTTASDNHTRLLEDDLMKKIINSRLSPKSDLGEKIHNEFKESFNRCMERKEQHNTLQNELPIKSELKPEIKVRKMKI